MESVNKLQPDFHALFPDIPPEALDLIILRKCTYLMSRIAKRGHKMHSINVIVDGCGSFKAIDKRLQRRRAKGDKESARKSARKHYKKIRLTRITQYI